MDHSAFAVTFDFHNTLAHADTWFALEVHDLVPAFLTWYAAEQSLTSPSDALIEEGRKLYKELRHQIFKSGNEQDAVSCLLTVLPKIGWDVPLADIETGVDTLMHATLDEGVAPLDGAVETVKHLAEVGVPLGVVSSAIYPPFLEWTLERFAIRDAFQEVVTSASAGFYKSNPQIYRHSAEMLATSPTQMIHIGDSFGFDVESAREAGYRTVWLRLGREIPAGEPPDLILDDLTDAAPKIAALLDDMRSTATITR